MKNKRPIILTFSIVATAIIIVFLMVSHLEKHTEIKYNLSEINDGIYVIYHHTISSIPAQNYDVVEICSDNQLMTFDGTVNITYIDDKPYAIIARYYNAVHSDKINIYVPRGSVLYQEDVGVR